MQSSNSRRPPPATSAKPNHGANFVSISSLFVFWKFLLLAVVAASPGPGYDTSAGLLLAHQQDTTTAPASSGLQRGLSHLLLRLVRWDALYFVNIAERGYLFEQEWAFSRAFGACMSTVAKAFPASFPQSALLQQALAGVLISHLAHLLSCFLIYALTFRLLPATFRDRSAVATLAACFHILSPAGVFLSAPYTEALFSTLNILGFFLLTFTPEPPRSVRHIIFHNFLAVCAGLSFATASTIRGNGLLSVLAFAIYALPIAVRTLTRVVTGNELCALPGLVLGAAANVIGFGTPQYVAFNQYCLGAQRPWCENLPPSIYTFVQAHYWNSGFLKYWTMSNLPLFLIAAPMLALLVTTAVTDLLPLLATLKKRSAPPQFLISAAATAAPQLALAVLALTSFHVQIVNRISSGYPTWYIALAVFCHTGDSHDSIHPRLASFLPHGQVQRRLARAIMLYGIVQAGLYASFLPPA